MLTEVEESVVKSAVKELIKNDKIKDIGKYFEYIEHPKIVENAKIINKSVEVKNSNIRAIEAVKRFLQSRESKALSFETLKTYKTFLNAHIVPYFYKFLLKDIKIEDVENFKNYLQEKKISERRIKNILTLLNQIIKHFQDEGYIERTCVFEVKRLEKIPKRKVRTDFFNIKQKLGLENYMFDDLRSIDNEKFIFQLLCE